jgi:hypothetical protein
MGDRLREEIQTVSAAFAGLEVNATGWVIRMERVSRFNFMTGFFSQEATEFQLKLRLDLLTWPARFPRHEI